MANTREGLINIIERFEKSKNELVRSVFQMERVGGLEEQVIQAKQTIGSLVVTKAQMEKELFDFDNGGRK